MQLSLKQEIIQGKIFLNSLKETEVDSSKETKIELNLVPSSQFDPNYNNPER